MKKGGTLFSYFQPTSNGRGPKQSPKTPKAKAKKATSPASGKKARKGFGGGDTAVSSGLLVWAKMEGHPWWPAMVTPHSLGDSDRVLRGKKCLEAHVQFFGQPPTRGWVPVTNIESLTEATITHHQENEEGFVEAIKGAKEALGLSLKARLELVVDIPSEGEEEGGNQENVEPMEVSSSGRKRPCPLPGSDEDSDDEIGVRKIPTGRPKRAASMSIKERARAKKRFRRTLDSEDSEDEYRPGSDDGESEECSSGEEEVESEATQSSEEEVESIVTPAKKMKGSGKGVGVTPKTPKPPVRVSTPASAVKASSSPPLSPAPPGHSRPFLHERLSWLEEANRKDKSGRGINDPEYNPRTLKLPPDFLKNLTPAMRQWWIIKADNLDTVLMFKVGKFYELYHMDAVMGVQELGLVFMKGDFAHSGFPEIAFGRYSQTLVQKGYKVARVEQTETPQMMEQRVRTIAHPTKFDRVVRREVCSVITKGTRTLSFFDGEITDAESSFLLAVKEKPHPQSQGESVCGVCFLDTCIGRFHLGQFSDDRQCSRLRTLIAHYPPAQVLYERGNLSVRTQHVVNQLLATSIRDSLAPNSEFWDSSRTLKHLAEDSYFSPNNSGDFEWPETLKNMLAEDDSLGLTATDSHELAISALGACVWYLKHCCIDHEMLSMRNFELYIPLDITEVGGAPSGAGLTRQNMVLDDITLANLDVIDTHGKLESTLLDRIDQCVTPFGKRLLKQWLSAPLCSPQAINERLDAVGDLMANVPVMGEAKDALRALPDLERLLRKIHTMGLAVRSQDHPDGRAIFYEETIYSKRKISDFISILNGLQSSLEILKVFGGVADELSSRLLKQLVTSHKEGGRFPDIEEKLHVFQHSFDHAKAKKEGIIIPSEGVNASYDKALREMQLIKGELDEYLQRQRKRLGCRQIVYWGSGRNRYQLEVPEAALARHTPDEYELKSQKKGYRRYWTKDIEVLLERLIVAEESRAAALKDTMRVVFESFSEHLGLWDTVVQILAVLDALMSLATYSCCSDSDMCRPEVVTSEVPFLELRDGKHPCVTQTYTGGDFIPNDVTINSGDSPSGTTCVVVTGPNMGGKSTLMRQTGLIVVLAQMGCYVPASVCRLSPVDRIFTRLGASDRIMSGESTFFVELSETSTILQHATPHSFVLLDELGRGTATYDGTAIASAVVRELAETIRCRTMFSTHYHSLVEELAGHPHIQLGHMACMVEKEGEEDDCDQETITFLYKFVEGACPKSYGFNAARLAGLPEGVIALARSKAREFERSSEQLKIFRQLTVQGEPGLEALRSAQRQIAAMS